MGKKHYYVCANGNRIEVPCPVAWKYANALTKRIEQIDMKKDNWKFEMSSGYGGYRCKKCGTWRYANETKICYCNKIMKNKKYKVKITKEKVVIKPIPGHEIDQDLICVLNRHYEHNGIFKPIKKELPKTWDAYCELREVVIPYQFSIISKYGEEIQALAKLIELRDHYNDGWILDWKNEDQAKYGISILNGYAIVDKYNLFSVVLSFKSPELRDEFLKNFAELIETAKPLL